MKQVDDIKIGDLGTGYLQCSAGKRNSLICDTVNIVINGENSSVIPESSIHKRLGGLDLSGDSDSVHKTFHGARMCKGNQIVNECISLSFDPSNLRCLACSDQHMITEQRNNPLVIIVGDQNFVPFLKIEQSGPDTGSGLNTVTRCCAVVRLENVSLSDLVDITMEVFDREKNIPPGSVILVGSGSHLYRNGSSQYASDWCLASHRLTTRYKDMHVGPLAPIFREDVPGSVAKDLLQIATWFAQTYAKGCWTTGPGCFLTSAVTQ